MPTYGGNQPPTANTGAGINAQIDAKRLWEKGALLFEQTEDFFQQFEGSEGSKSLIEAKTETSKGAGQKITFKARAGFYGEGKRRDQTFDETTDFESIKMDDFDLIVDWIRNGTRYTERSEELVGIRGELEDGLPEELGRWLGRKKSEEVFMTCLHRLNSDNRTVAAGKTEATLLSTSTLNWNEIVKLGVVLKRNGGTPARVGSRKSIGGGGMSTAIRRNVVVSPSDNLMSLKTDTVYQGFLKDAAPDANNNYLFTGEFADVDGHCISEYVAIDHDGFGPIGSPWNPRAKIGTAVLAATTTAVALTFGGSAAGAALTTPLYTKWFPGYAYEFIDGTTVTPGAGPFYCLVVNPPNSPTDPSKVGMFSYTTGNNGNQITTVNRLAGTASGANVTTLGGVDWSTAPWSGNVTAYYAVGAVVIPCNRLGVPFGYTTMFGARALYRGYGKHRAKRGNESKEDDFVREIYIKSVFGQTPVKDAALRIPGISVLQHAITYSDLPIPSVTS